MTRSAPSASPLMQPMFGISSASCARTHLTWAERRVADAPVGASVVSCGSGLRPPCVVGRSRWAAALVGLDRRPPPIASSLFFSTVAPVSKCASSHYDGVQSGGPDLSASKCSQFEKLACGALDYSPASLRVFFVGRGLSLHVVRRWAVGAGWQAQSGGSSLRECCLPCLRRVGGSMGAC